ncbi:MAG: molecular chaperone DnaJ [Peptococcaceae bacterium]|jgi:molecular chaperone DnaJ|nr:molecular chaperone DnaJ [Peptococcaceae bacterium]MDR2736016.1 molecular chaperone DnaJ [Gracilibacteraceae bacterium]
MKRDYYEVLGVTKNAEADEIKKAYRQIAKENHPDIKPGDQQAEERFKEATEAYAVLSDAEKRRRYDQFGHASVEGDAFSGFNMSDFSDLGLADIFSMFFGGGGRTRSRGPARGSDLRYDLRISLEEAAFGVNKTIEYPRSVVCSECRGSGAAPGTQPVTCSTCSGSGQMRQVQRTPFGQMATSRPCSACQGHGQIITTPCPKCSGKGLARESKQLEVVIPAGAEDNLSLYYANHGEVGEKGGAAGDLYVVLNVKRHDFFERHGDDVYCEVPITFVQAALGADIEVPTLHGTVSIKVPEGTQTGKVFRVRGMGIPQRRNDQRGDQHVRVLVATPVKLTEAQKDLLREFGEVTPEDKQQGKKSFWDKVKQNIQNATR